MSSSTPWRCARFAVTSHLAGSVSFRTSIKSWQRPLLATALMLCCGCANFQEKRTITAFQQGMEARDLTALREKASAEFATKALRHPQADESLTQLKLPDGKFKILDVETESPTVKKVTVGFGEAHDRKILYRLVKDQESRSWKVDDIYMRQRSGDKKVALAVTEQMDVLLSAREFYDAWSSNDRSSVLESSQLEMRQELAKLPPSILASYVSKLMGATDRSGPFRPEAMISGDEAVVKLNRAHGTIVMSMENSDKGWLVKDVALEGRGKDAGISSLTRTVQITNVALTFLDSYGSNNKDELKLVTEDRFFSAGLAPSNLRDMPLPGSADLSPEIDVKLRETHADVIVSDSKQTVCLALGEVGEKSGVYRVADVSIYQLNDQRSLSLSSAMTARPIAELFLSSLQQRDQKMLQYSSTLDLHKKTWARVSPQTLAIIPLPVQDFETFELVETQFAATVTHVIAHAGDQKLMVILHDQNGKVVVDDLLVTSLSGDENQTPRSLKHELATLAPVYELAASIHNNQPPSTLRLVTDDFYERVFSLANAMPESAYQFLDLLSSGNPKIRQQNSDTTPPANMTAKLIQPRTPVIEKYKEKEGQIVVEFHSLRGTMQVTLLEEQGLLRVDDALVTGPNSEVAVRLKQNMRMDLASGRAQSMIRTVSGETRTITPATGSKTAALPRPPIATPTQSPTQPLPESSLQNALYEQFSQQSPGAIEQTGGTPAIPGQLSPTMLTPAVARPHNASFATPALLDQSSHPLLKPIPIP